VGSVWSEEEMGEMGEKEEDDATIMRAGGWRR